MSERVVPVVGHTEARAGQTSPLARPLLAALVALMLAASGCIMGRPLKRAALDRCPGELEALAFAPDDYCVHTYVADPLGSRPLDVPAALAEHVLVDYARLAPSDPRLEVLGVAVRTGLQRSGQGQVQVELADGPVATLQVAHDHGASSLIVLVQEAALLGAPLYYVDRLDVPAEGAQVTGWHPVAPESAGQRLVVADVDSMPIFAKREFSTVTSTSTATVRRGRVLEVLGADGSHLHLRLPDGSTGWTHEYYVTRLFTLPAPSP